MRMILDMDMTTMIIKCLLIVLYAIIYCDCNAIMNKKQRLHCTVYKNKAFYLNAVWIATGNGQGRDVLQRIQHLVEPFATFISQVGVVTAHEQSTEI